MDQYKIKHEHVEGWRHQWHIAICSVGRITVHSLLSVQKYIWSCGPICARLWIPKDEETQRVLMKGKAVKRQRYSKELLIQSGEVWWIFMACEIDLLVARWSCLPQWRRRGTWWYTFGWRWRRWSRWRSGRLWQLWRLHWRQEGDCVRLCSDLH